MTSTAERSPRTVRPHKTVRSSSKLVLRNTLTGWMFILPNFLGFALLTMVPVVTLFYYAFTSWNAFGKAKFSGLENFATLLKDPAHSGRPSGTPCTTRCSTSRSLS